MIVTSSAVVELQPQFSRVWYVWREARGVAGVDI